MGAVIRIATWNLERCSSSQKVRTAAQQRRINEVDADIWVFTETYIDRSPGPGYVGVHSPPHPTRRSSDEERFVGVWSRWPTIDLARPQPHPRGSVATRITTPVTDLIVYGSVIAYGGERYFEDGTPARPWEVHAAEIERQSREWRCLRERHPDVPIIVAGDFNQARSGRPHSYGTNALRDELSMGLAAAGLRSLTDVDLVSTGKVSGRSHVEHICATPELTTVGEVMAWDRHADDGRRLSDHPTIAVDLSIDIGMHR